MENIYVIQLNSGNVTSIIPCGSDNDKAELEFANAIRKLSTEQISEDDMNCYIEDGYYNEFEDEIQLFHQIN